MAPGPAGIRPARPVPPPWRTSPTPEAALRLKARMDEVVAAGQRLQLAYAKAYGEEIEDRESS